MKKIAGFTLLELVIVIVIVGVLAAMGLPKMFSAIEFARSTEAMATIAAIRRSTDLCFLMNNQMYSIGGSSDCDAGQASGPGGDWSNLDIDDPSSAPNAHFWYWVNVDDNTEIHIWAYRSTKDGGDTASRIVMEIDQLDDDDPSKVAVFGYGVYQAMK